MEVETASAKLAGFKYEESILVWISFHSNNFKQGVFYKVNADDDSIEMYDENAGESISVAIVQIRNIQHLVGGRMGPIWVDV